MDIDGPDDSFEGWLEIDCYSSWEIYFRLQELDVPCFRESYQPLQVNTDTPLALVQAWSVFRQFTQPRQVLVSWLNHCWAQAVQEPYFPIKS